MEITDRIKASTPPFFKKVRRIGLALTAIAGCVLTANTEGSLEFPEWLVDGSKYITFMGVVAAAVAQTAKEDK